MRKTLALISLILCTISLVAWLGGEQAQTLIPKPQSRVSQATSYALLQNPQSRHFNEQGQLAYQYKADRMEYFREDLGRIGPTDYSLVQQPELIFYGDGLPWFIAAKAGKILDQGNTLELWDQVRIWQNRPDGSQTLVTTERLTLKPKQQAITTAEPVQIKSPSGTLSGTGLSVDLAAQTVKLHSKVKGQHESVY
jgi:lipopolysaccharide export system protein LptC